MTPGERIPYIACTQPDCPKMGVRELQGTLFIPNKPTQTEGVQIEGARQAFDLMVRCIVSIYRADGSEWNQTRDRYRLQQHLLRVEEIVTIIVCQLKVFP